MHPISDEISSNYTFYKNFLRSCFPMASDDEIMEVIHETWLEFEENPPANTTNLKALIEMRLRSRYTDYIRGQKESLDILDYEILPMGIQDRYHCTLCGHELSEDSTYRVTYYDDDTLTHINYCSICKTQCPREYKSAQDYKSNIQLSEDLFCDPYHSLVINIDLEEFLSTLPEKERECVEAIYLGYFTPKEIAEKYNLKYDTVYRTALRTIEKLKDS